MASAANTDWFASTFSIEALAVAPGTTAATVPTGGWRLMRDYERFLVTAVNTVLAGNGLVRLEIVAADDTSGTNTVVVADSGVITPGTPTVGDYAFLEIQAVQIREVVAAAGVGNGQYVAARVTVQNSGDKVAVTYIRKAKREQLGLTANVIH